MGDLMSESFPGPGDADFFGRIPLFREFARLLSGAGGPVNWELARQVAVAAAAGADDLGMIQALPEPVASAPFDAAEQQSWDEALRLAELWLAPVTTLTAAGIASARPLRRPDWAEAALKALPPLIEPAAARLAGSTAGAAAPAEVTAMASRLGGLLYGIQLGGAVGQLARAVTGHYDVLLPAGGQGGLPLVPENVAALEQDAGLPGDQLRLWIAARQLARGRVIEGAGWLVGHLASLLEEVAAATDPAATGLADQLAGLDLSNPESVQALLANADLLGTPASPAAREALGRVEALLAVVDGYGTVIAASALSGRLPALERIAAAVRERDERPEGAPHLFAGVLQADPERAAGRRGEAFCREVLAATDIDGLDRVWAHENFLPSPDELDAPGRWLERMGLIGGEAVDLDEGLRRLLDGGQGPDEPA
jgi:putative hydrolase